MRIFQALVFLGFLTLACHGVIVPTLGAVCLKLFYSSMITKTVDFFFDIATFLVENSSQIKGGKQQTTEGSEIKAAAFVGGSEKSSDFELKSELEEIARSIEKVNKNVKESFEKVKHLLRDQHFQTNVQFKTENLILHLEHFLRTPTNTTEGVFLNQCIQGLPSSLLKTIESFLKDKWLAEQSSNDMKAFEKLERGLALMVKQLILAQSVCLRIQHSCDKTIKFYKGVSIEMTKNIEFYIQKQKSEVQVRSRMLVILRSTLPKDNKDDGTDHISKNTVLKEIREKMCQKLKSDKQNSNIDVFLTGNSSVDLTIATKNRYYQERFNDWTAYVFYPKFTSKSLARRKSIETIDADEDAPNRVRKVVKNQVLFECKNNSSSCGIFGTETLGMLTTDMSNYTHFAVCGNVAVSIGYPVTDLDKNNDQYYDENEKDNFQQWEAIQTLWTQLRNSRKVEVTISTFTTTVTAILKDKKPEQLIEATNATVLKENEVARLPQALITNNAESLKNVYVFIFLCFAGLFF